MLLNSWETKRGCPGVPVHEGIPFVFITIHGVMTQFVNVSFLCVPVHEDTTDKKVTEVRPLAFVTVHQCTLDNQSKKLKY